MKLLHVKLLHGLVFFAYRFSLFDENQIKSTSHRTCHPFRRVISHTPTLPLSPFTYAAVGSVDDDLSFIRFNFQPGGVGPSGVANDRLNGVSIAAVIRNDQPPPLLSL